MTGKLGIAMLRTSAAVVAWLTALWCSAPVAAQTIDQLYTLAKQDKDTGHVGSRSNCRLR